MRARRRQTPTGLALIIALLLPACSAPLPEPQSAGAKLYEQRCGGCHRLYVPNLLTYPMWEVILKRMQGEMARRGVKPLSADERAVIAPYLERHAARPEDAQQQP